MKRVLIVLLMFSGCERRREIAATHLLNLGYKQVACESGGTWKTGDALDASCTADGQRFRCLVVDDTGCDRDIQVACERSWAERPAP